MITGKLKQTLHHQIKSIKITSEMVETAIDKGTTMGELKNSIKNGEGNAGGFLGEEIIKAYLNCETANTYDYDLIFKGKKLEVKTKLTTVEPKITYDCSVAAYNSKQKCDMYVFTRVNEDLTEGWIMGYLSKEDFYKKSKFSPEGTFDPSNDYTEKADCFKLPASSLKNIVNLLDEL